MKIFIFFLILIPTMLVIGSIIDAQETNMVDAPIISDKVATGENIRIVDKDESQRVSDKTTLRIQRLENRVTDLEFLVAELQSVE